MCGSTFELAGLQISITMNGLQWRIDPASVSPGIEFLSIAVPVPTSRSLWRLLGFIGFAFTVLLLPVRYLGFARIHQARYHAEVYRRFSTG